MWQQIQARILNLKVNYHSRYDDLMERIGPALQAFYWFGLLACPVFCIYWIRHVPSAGIAIGALGAVGVLVALRGDKISGGHKVLWALITLIFLVTEVRAIKKQDEEHAESMRQILQTYNSEMAQNQTHFDETMNRLDIHTSKLGGLAKTEENITGLSQQNLNEITGKKGYCSLLAIINPFDGDLSRLPLMVINPTKYPVIGANADIMEMIRPGDSQDEMLRKIQSTVSIPLGDVWTTYARQVGYRLPVRKDRDNKFSITIFSRGSSTRELLVITWDKDHWAEDSELSNTHKKIRADFPYIEKNR
jgi:hypothetical protein